MEIHEGIHFLQVEKRGVVDSSNIVAVRDAKGLTCFEIGGGGEENIRQTRRLFEEEGLDVSNIHTIIVSHTHADHMGAIAHFRERIPGLTVVDHELDAPFLQDCTLLNRIFDADLVPIYFPDKRLDILEFYETFCPISEARPDRTVVEGDRLACGRYVFEVLHTPGHHPGHISLYERDLGMLYVGDMVGLEVPFYTPSSGGLTGYLRSIEKYQALDAKLIVPSHGDLIEAPREALENVAAKVRRREERLLDALADGSKTFHELLPVLFRNPGGHMFPGAAILASHLEKLQEDGTVVEEEGRYGRVRA